jgi:hypothetical protein
MCARRKQAIAFLCVLAAAMVSLAGTAQADLPPNCVVSGQPDPTALRIQADSIQFIPAIEAELGSQDGSVWLCPGDPQFDVGVAPGPQSVAAASAAIDAIIVAQLGASEAAWFESYVDVQSVPYSQAQLAQIVAAISSQFEQLPPPVFLLSVGPNVQAGQVEVTIEADATSAQLAAAQTVVNEYGGIAVLILSNAGPAEALGASSTPAASTSTPVPSAPGLSQPTSPTPALAGLSYRRHLDRALITVTPGSSALHDVVVSAISRSGRVLARRNLATVTEKVTIALHLKAAPAHLTIELHATSATGTPVVLQRAA